MRPKMQVYAVVRVDTDSELPPGGTGPGIDMERLRGMTLQNITVQAVLPSMEEAMNEVQRLNALNAAKGASYFWMATRYYPQGRGADTASSE